MSAPNTREPKKILYSQVIHHWNELFRDFRGASRSYLTRALAKRELLISIPPFASRRPRYLMKPRILNLFMKKLTRDRVVPIIVARVPCDIPLNRCSLPRFPLPESRRRARASLLSLH